MGAATLTSRAIIGEFYATLEQDEGQSWFNDISMYFTSNQDSETYAWLGATPAMQQWIGGRHAKGFRENGISISNLDFEATLEVLVKELRRDKTGQIMVRIREMAARANAHWAKLLSELIELGESTVCYDGQFFFDTDHSQGDSGTQSNDISVTIASLPVTNHGSVTAPSVGEMQQSILQGIQQIYGFKDDQAEPMNEMARRFLVMVPVSLFNVANAATALPMVDSGESNIIPNSDFQIRVASNARLTWTDKFSVFRADGQVKPFIRQEEKPIEMKAVAEGSELEFKHNKHWYGVDSSRNVGFGYWEHACLVTMV